MRDETAPPKKSSRFSDQDLENEVATMLRIGVTLSALIVLAGGLWMFRQPHRAVPELSHFHAVEPALQSFRGVFAAAFRHAPGQSRGIMQLGLLVLIATPVLRVALCVVGFARQRNWLYVAVSAVVFLVLLWSLLPAAA
ncbi:Uncharacterized membrane protein [Bryocella elongata]|uniref:Uncharacterized membrane protein n=1 Tax=Bryocella elongata TaxID=863522 RepID=A0A1H5U593_9BACT|nr:DUF1634 domain-containing protein [Bryocella elongata]SEF70214.1 Uncharacterized membrane protein [Bryocella elongata]